MPDSPIKLESVRCDAVDFRGGIIQNFEAVWLKSLSPFLSRSKNWNTEFHKTTDHRLRDYASLRPLTVCASLCNLGPINKIFQQFRPQKGVILTRNSIFSTMFALQRPSLKSARLFTPLKHYHSLQRCRRSHSLNKPQMWKTWATKIAPRFNREGFLS